MWRPLQFYRERRRIRSIFREQLSPALLEALEKDLAPLSTNLQSRTIDFILLQVRDMPTEGIQNILSPVLDALIDSHATISQVWPLTMGYFGIPVETPTDENRSKRHAAILALVAASGPDVRMLHGATECLFGNIGSSGRCDYNVLLPHFSDLISILLGMDFGQTAKVDLVDGKWSVEG